MTSRAAGGDEAGTVSLVNRHDGLVGVVFVVCLARVVFAGGVDRPRNVFAIPALADDDENVVHFARHQPTLPGVPIGTCTPTQLHGVQVRHATARTAARDSAAAHTAASRALHTRQGQPTRHPHPRNRQR